MRIRGRLRKSRNPRENVSRLYSSFTRRTIIVVLKNTARLYTRTLYMFSHTYYVLVLNALNRVNNGRLAFVLRQCYSRKNIWRNAAEYTYYYNIVYCNNCWGERYARENILDNLRNFTSGVIRFQVGCKIMLYYMFFYITPPITTPTVPLCICTVSFWFY